MHPIRDILFLCDQPTPRVTKLAVALQRAGVTCRVFALFDPVHPALRPDASGVPYQRFEDLRALRAAVRASSAQVLHIQPFNAKEPVRRMVEMADRPVVLDCYDFFRNCFRLDPGGPMDRMIGDHESAAVMGADGLIGRDLGLWQFCRINGLTRRRPTLFFPDYCAELPSPPPPRPAKPYLDIVFAGSVEIEPDFSLVREGGAIGIARALTSLGHHLHFFRHLPVADAPGAEAGFAAIAPGQIHFHGSLPPAALARRLPDFDLGCHIFQIFFLGRESKTFVDGFYRYQISARCFDYVQAALPMLSSAEFRFRERYFNNPNFMIDCNINGLRANPALLQQRLAGIDRAALAAWGAKFHIDRHIPRLLRFYEDVCRRTRRSC